MSNNDLLMHQQRTMRGMTACCPALSFNVAVMCCLGSAAYVGVLLCLLLIAEQDDVLDILGNSITRTKELAYGIGNEAGTAAV